MNMEPGSDRPQRHGASPSLTTSARLSASDSAAARTRSPTADQHDKDNEYQYLIRLQQQAIQSAENMIHLLQQRLQLAELRQSSIANTTPPASGLAAASSATNHHQTISSTNPVPGSSTALPRQVQRAATVNSSSSHHGTVTPPSPPPASTSTSASLRLQALARGLHQSMLAQRLDEVVRARNVDVNGGGGGEADSGNETNSGAQARRGPSVRVEKRDDEDTEGDEDEDDEDEDDEEESDWEDEDDEGSFDLGKDELSRIKASRMLEDGLVDANGVRVAASRRRQTAKATFQATAGR